MSCAEEPKVSALSNPASSIPHPLSTMTSDCKTARVLPRCPSVRSSLSVSTLTTMEVALADTELSTRSKIADTGDRILYALTLEVLVLHPMTLLLYSSVPSVFEKAEAIASSL